MSADFVLYLRDVLEDSKNQDWTWNYWPETLVYMPEYGGPIEVFARAQSTRFFNDMKVILGISAREELEPIFEAMRQGKIRVPRWELHSIDPGLLCGFNKIASKP